ncbi:MAG: hypothetical protein IPP46_18995 [Bacteroidetes bacterium]|nr:hypothetical protein [Bacteroidota bacterium]
MLRFHGARPDNFSALNPASYYFSNNTSAPVPTENYPPRITTNGTQLPLDIIPGNSSSSPTG